MAINLVSVGSSCIGPLSHLHHVLNSALFQCISNASPMHLQSSPAYSDTLHIGLCMLCNSALPPASAPLHMLPLLVCLFVSPSGLFPLIDVQCTSARSNCTHSIRRALGRRLRSSLLLNSSPSTSRDHPLVTKHRSTTA